jgi:O-antigen/teichoic acid export membrane protein
MLFAKIRSLLNDRIIQNVSWLGTSELINRIFRLGTTFVLARNLEPTEYGLMAILYIYLEFSQVFIWHGITSKIIQVDEKDLQSTCNTAYWINWLICISAFLIQCLSAYPISKLYNSEQIFLPLCWSATTYLIIPLFLVKAALLERAGRMKEIAFINSAQSIFSNLMIIILVILNFGIWSISVSISFSTALWLIVNLRESSWTQPQRITFENWREIVGYSKNIVGIQLLNKVRGNLDYLIIGKFLSLDKLGLYYFAFNAGSGITMNVVNTFVWALFPYFCSIRQDRQKLKKEYFRNLKRIVLLISAVVFAQSSLSFFYVPFIMGEKWIPAIPILILICLSVIPSSLKLIGSILLNADNKAHLTLLFDIIYTIVFSISLLVVVNIADASHAIYWVSFNVLIFNIIMGIVFFRWSNQKAFGTYKVIQI